MANTIRLYFNAKKKKIDIINYFAMTIEPHPIAYLNVLNMIKFG